MRKLYFNGGFFAYQMSYKYVAYIQFLWYAKCTNILDERKNTFELISQTKLGFSNLHQIKNGKAMLTSIIVCCTIHDIPMKNITYKNLLYIDLVDPYLRRMVSEINDFGRDSAESGVLSLHKIHLYQYTTIKCRGLFL